MTQTKTDKKNVIPIEFNPHLYDATCKVAISSLDKHINQALLKATIKTAETLFLMSKLQKPQALFQKCTDIFSLQQELLLNVKLFNDGNNLTSNTTPQSTSTIGSQNALEAPSIQRLIKARKRNRASCTKIYLELLQSSPLLEPPSALPETSQILLSRSPERCAQKLISMLTLHADQQQLQQEAVVINHLILSSFFFSHLSGIYTAFSKNLLTLFKTFETPSIEITQPAPQVPPPLADQTTEKDTIIAYQLIQSDNQLRALPSKALPSASAYQNPHNRQLQTNSTTQKSMPILSPEKTAVERQISERVDLEQTTAAQLKKTVKGTLFQWAHSYSRAPGKYIKYIDHDPVAHIITFHDEHTAEFIRYDIDTLTQAVLAGDLVKRGRKTNALRRAWTYTFTKT